SENAVRVVSVVLREATAQGPREAAWREGRRWVSALKKIELAAVPKIPLPFQRGGFYLLSGGLGGVGVEIARQLLQLYQARLLLIGRTALPERVEWPDLLAKNDPRADRIRALQSLEELGEVLYSAADVADVNQLREAVGLAENRF